MTILKPYQVELISFKHLEKRNEKMFILGNASGKVNEKNHKIYDEKHYRGGCTWKNFRCPKTQCVFSDYVSNFQKVEKLGDRNCIINYGVF